MWSQDGNVISGATGNTLSVNASGTYSVQVTHLESGCFATDEVVVAIEESLSPVASIEGPETMNCGEALELTASVDVLGENPSYQWFRNGEEILGEVSDSLTLTEYANNDEIKVAVNADLACVAEAATAIYTVNAPAIAGTPVLPADISRCASEELPVITAEGEAIFWYANAELTVLINEGNALELPELTYNDATEAEVTFYAVSQPENSCASQVASIKVITRPTPVINLPEEILRCSPANIVLDAGYDPADGYTIEWSNTTDNTRTNTVSSTGNYSVKVTHNASGCFDYHELFVLISDSFESRVEITAEAEPVCGGDALVLNAELVNYGENPSYTWTLNGTILEGERASRLSLENNAAGDEITVEVDVDLDCAAQAIVSDSYTVNLPDLSAPALTVSDNDICLGSANPTFTASNFTDEAYLRWYAGSVAEENLVASGVATYTPAVSEVGTYTYLVTQETANCGETEAGSAGFTISNGENCNEGGGGNGGGNGGEINCSVFTIELTDKMEPSCDRNNGYLQYSVTGGVAPYTISYSFVETNITQVLTGDTVYVNINQLPANKYVTLSVVDAQGKACSLDSLRLTMAPRITAKLTKADGGDVTCYGEQMGKARLEIIGGNAPFDYKLNEGAWVETSFRTIDLR